MGDLFLCVWIFFFKCEQDNIPKGSTRRRASLFIYATWSTSIVLVVVRRCIENQNNIFLLLTKFAMHSTIYFSYLAAHTLNTSREAKRFPLVVLVRAR